MTTLPQRTPENDALHRECALLHEELARLLVERTTLLELTGPALEARYRLELGALQLTVLEAECGVRRLRRKLELLRAALNRGAIPDLAAVSAQLDAELIEWQARLRAETARLEAARLWAAAPLLGVAEARELQELFRRLAKRCHPDASPEGGAAANALWLQASAAYAAGDLEGLRALALLADDLPAAGSLAEGVRERRDALKAAVARLVAELAEIGLRFPFTLRDLLDDPARVEAERQTLTARHDALAAERVLLEVTLHAIVGEVAGG